MIKRGRQGGVEIRDMATNPFSCKFFQKKNMKMVLKMFQSNFDKNLVVINKMDKEAKPTMAVLNKYHFWIKIYDL